MNKEKKLAKNTAIVGMGKICTQLMSFLLLPLYTEKLEPSSYGMVDIYQTYTSIIIVIIFLQLEQALFRFLIDTRKSIIEKKIVISTVLSWSFIIDSLLLAVCIIFKVFRVDNSIYYVFLMTVSMHFMENMLQLSRGEGDNLSYSVANFISASLLLLLNIVFIVCFKFQEEGMIYSFIISNVIGGGYLFLKKNVLSDIGFKYIKLSTLKLLFKYSLPLVPNALSWWIVSASDRVIISYFMGSAAVGIISVSQKFSTAIFNVYCVFNITWNEYVAINIEDADNTKFSETMEICINFFGGICAIIITFLPIIFPYFIDVKYSEANKYIPIYILSTFFNICVNMVNAFYAGLKKTKSLAFSSVVVASINICINLILVKRIGIYAAALSSVFAFGLVTIWRMFDITRYIRVKINARKILEILFVFSISFGSYFMNISLFQRMVVILVEGCLCVIWNRNYFKVITNVIKSRVKM